MANGSNDATLGRIVSRRTTRRRLLMLGWIAVAALPGAAESFAQGSAADRHTPRPAAVAQAIAQGDQQQPGAVTQTAGGLLDQLFGSQPSASKAAKDDGRKAYPLPPPDPSSVNWSGIPYHQPKPGTAASAAAPDDRPIRDVQAKRGAGTATGRDAHSAGAAAATDSRLPQPPQLQSPQLQSPPAATAAARIATVAPLPPPKLPSTRSASELSTNSSSRRSGRRAIDPLNSDELLPATVDVNAQGASSGLDFESIARREVEQSMPLAAAEAEAKLSSLPSPSARGNGDSPSAAAPPAAKTPASATIPALAAPTPPSLATIDAEMADQQARRKAARKEAAARAQAAEPALAAPAAAQPTTADSLNPSKPEQYIGSGVAAQLTPPAIATPAESAKPQPPSDAITLAPLADAAIDPIPSGRQTQQPAAGEAAEFVARGQLKDLVSGTSASDKGKQLAASEQPGIRVVTEGPSQILIRELTQYEVRVENRGSFDATGVVVRTSLPPWAEVQGHNASSGAIAPMTDDENGQLQWTLDSLPAGVVERLFIRIKPIRSGSFDVATHWSTMPQTHTAQVMVREPKLAIEIEGPDEIIYGQSQKYRVRVLNPGDAVASNVLFTLVPETGDSVEQKIGNIPAGKEASFEIELTARDLEQLKINGTATADLDLRAAAKKSVAVSAATIEATLSGPTMKFQNTDAAYQLQLTNSGRAVCESITGEVQLPTGMKYVGGIEGARLEGDRLSWMIGELTPGETRDYAFTCKMEHTGTHPIAFHCTGSAAGSASVGIETTVQAIADLKLSVIDPPAPAAVGSEVTYEVWINNRGSKAAEDVRVVAQFGNGIEPIRVEGHRGDLITGQVLFNPIPRIEAGGEVKLRIAAKADRAGDHRFRAEVRSGETVLVAEEATMYVEIRNERVSRSSSAPAKR